MKEQGFIKDRTDIYRQIKPYFTKQRGKMTGLSLIKLAGIPLAMVPPYLFKVLIDDVMLSRRITLLFYVIFGNLAVFGVQWLLKAYEIRLGNRLSNQFKVAMSNKLWKRYLMAPAQYYETLIPGDVKKTLDEDLNEMSRLIEAHYLDYLIAWLVVAFNVAAMLMINLKLSVISLILAPVLLYLGVLIGKGDRKVWDVIREIHNRYETWQHDVFEKWREIKAMNMEAKVETTFEKFRRRIGRYGHLSNDLFFWASTEYVTLKKEFVVKILLYVFGLSLVLSGELVIGSLLMFMEYYNKVFESVELINNKNVELKKMQVRTKRVFSALYDLKTVASDGWKPERLQGKVSFKKVSFSYQEELGPVLQDVSFEIHPGEHVAIVGKSGSGKSTLLKLMIGFFTPKQGEILLDDRPVGQYDYRAFHQRLAVVMQDSLLFNLTIRDNLRLAKDDASIEELENACEKAELLDFIRGLKDGFETVIGERGIRLSGGQKQRFAIARVLLQKPDVIIFDEATSSLDHETEKNLKQNLEDFLRGKTTITIAHRFSTITTADKVIVLGDGRICAIGTHSQLQDTCDEYRRLFQRQWA